jgi:4-amino-4-deoxy-L-arabinose transferase-like glycosyltransferase
MSTARTRVPLWLVALLCLMAFAFQGTRGLWDPDEGRYSSGGIHMQQSGDWLIPTVDGETPHLTKPPLTYWALAASFTLLGRNEWAARLPGALAYIGTGLLLFGLGRRLCAGKPWLPSVVWGLSFAPVIAANIVSTDPLLAMFETAAMYAFVEAWSRDGADARRWFVWMWLAWGLSFMTKGPPGLLPLLAMTLLLAIHDRARLRMMYLPAGIVVFLVVAFTWFGVVVAQQPERLGYFLGYEVYDRVFTAVHDRNPQWYGAFEVYLPVLLAGTLPWLAFSLQAAGGPANAYRTLRSRLRERDRHWLLLCYWLLVPLAIFFLARSRLQLYVLPLFVPIALMMARPLARWRGLEGRRGVVIVALTAMALLGLKAMLAYWPSDRDSRDLAAQLRQQLATHPADEVIFVGMRPFYGLNVYLPQRIDGLEIDEWRFDESTHVTREQVCGEIGRRERTVYLLRERLVAVFERALVDCGRQPVRLGSVHADGHDLHLLAPGAGTR